VRRVQAIAARELGRAGFHISKTTFRIAEMLDAAPPQSLSFEEIRFRIMQTFVQVVE
jgi:hypothetical protein